MSESRPSVADPPPVAMTHIGQDELTQSLAPFLNVDHLTERVALAMAHVEGNREAQERAHLNNYDALGYTALAKAAVAEVQRLGALAWPAAANTAAGTAGKP